MKTNKFAKIILFVGLVAVAGSGFCACNSKTGSSVEASPMEATLTPDDGLILIVHQVEGKVSLVSGDDRQTFSISSDAIHFPDPVLSPDGTRIAFRDLDGSLNIYDISTQQTTTYTKADMNGIHPFGWSPDGEKIAYSCPTLPASICIFTLKTSEIKKFDHMQFDSTDHYGGYTFAGWSRDGKKIGILYQGETQTHSAVNYSVGTIKMLDLETETVTDVFSEGAHPGITRLQNAVLSPDGSSFLFSAMSGDYYAVYQVQVDGSGFTRITGEKYEFHFIHPVWKPDGQGFITVAPEQGEDLDQTMLVPTIFDLSGNIITQIHVDLGGIPTSWIGIE